MFHYMAKDLLVKRLFLETEIFTGAVLCKRLQWYLGTFGRFDNECWPFLMLSHWLPCITSFN